MGFKYSGFYFKIYFRHYNPTDESGKQLKKAYKRGTECFITVDGVEAAKGWARCSKSDNFSKNTGRLHSIRRALEQINGENIKDMLFIAYEAR